MSTSRRGGGDWPRPGHPQGRPWPGEPWPGEPWAERPAGDGRRRIYAVLGAAGVLAVVVAGLAVLRWNDRGAAGLGAGAYEGPPPTVSRAADGAFVMAWAEAGTPLLEIFTDYQCPVCRDAQEETGPLLRRLASQGRVRVVYRPVQGYRGPAHEPAASNSRRASNAVLCAPAAGWLAYHEAVFAHQPAEDASGFAPAELVALSRRAGNLGPAFPACVTGGAQSSRLDALTRYATVTRHVRKLPAAFLDGRPLDEPTQLDAGRLERAIHASSGG